MGILFYATVTTRTVVHRTPVCPYEKRGVNPHSNLVRSKYNADKQKVVMILRARVLQRRYLCTAGINPKAATILPNPHNHRWSIKQVQKSNFSEALEEIRNHIKDSHFIAVSLQKTGAYSAPWQRVLPLDSAETAYFKAKYAAERFQIFQFAVCPFSIKGSKLIAHPYNFHLFPRDELRIGMPSYSFLCQSTYLESMAKEGFDFNACIHEGISYISRAQESTAKVQLGNPVTTNDVVQSSSAISVADSVFVKRNKSKVMNWLSACKDSDRKTDEALIRSLRKLILGSEEYCSRPCLSIAVCSERQVQLVLEMLKEFSNDVVPLLISAKGGETLAVRVVLTRSKGDREIFEKELQDSQDEQNTRVRGFREVIDLISDSQKPVVAHNSLNDFTFIHSKFLAPLPTTVDEFSSSLHAVFPQILDINHLMKEIGPLKNLSNLTAAMSCLKKRFFAPIDMEISYQARENNGKIHGHNVLRISELFTKLCFILKITPENFEADNDHLSLDLEGYANIFSPCLIGCEHPINECGFWTNSIKKVSCKNLVFLWGFNGGMSAGMLKRMLCGSHEVFCKEFDVLLVDKSCAVVFSSPDLSECFLEAMDSEGFCCEAIREIISQGLRAASYQTYQQVCRLGLWERELADALDSALADPNNLSDTRIGKEPSEIYLNDFIINLDDL